MKKQVLIFTIIFATMALISCNNETIKQNDTPKDEVLLPADTIDATNNFYDNAETFNLEPNELEIAGEIENPGMVDFSKLPLRSVIVKETLLDEDGNKFVGAFRYDGYSLFDILNEARLAKKNGAEFPPIIDLFVEVENASGEKVVISWGEIFYANHLNEIIIATKVMRIVPSKTNELWTLPTKSKLVVSSDLITERNISSPTKITVKSYVKDLVVEHGKTPLFSPKFDFSIENEVKDTYFQNPKDINEIILHSIFYGRGRGIHSTQPFQGVDMKTFLRSYVKLTKKSIRDGILVVAADDGYRVVYTYSEICNRNDQADVLLIYSPELTHNGVFRLFPTCDFFSDRAIKGINNMYYSESQK